MIDVLCIEYNGFTSLVHLGMGPGYALSLEELGKLPLKFPVLCGAQEKPYVWDAEAKTPMVVSSECAFRAQVRAVHGINPFPLTSRLS